MVRGTHAGPGQAGECAQVGAWGEGAEVSVIVARL